MTHVRVLICEDSAVYAAGLRRALEYDRDITVIGVSPTAEEALAALASERPDLVTMDLELPGMDGLIAVEEIMSSRPVPVVVLSSHVGPDGEKAAAALGAGAVDAWAKSDLDLADPAGVTAAAFRARIRALARVPVIRHPRARLRQARNAPGPAAGGPRSSGSARPPAARRCCTTCSARCRRTTPSRCCWSSTWGPASPRAWSAGWTGTSASR